MILGLAIPAERAFAQTAALAGLADAAGVDFLLLPDVAALDGAVKHEAFALAAALSAVTTRIGLVVTASLDFNDPYNLARALATLDHLSGGRAGWLGVSGGSRAEAMNFGLGEVAPAGPRLARAAELLEVVRGLEDSWDDGAIPRDKPSGVFFDRTGMRPVEHVGAAFRVRGPLDVPTSPQRHLPLFCRDGADAACDFAARHADVVCADGAAIDGLKARADRLGRDPAALRVLMSVTVDAGADPAAVAAELIATVADGCVVTCADPGWFLAHVVPLLGRRTPDTTLRARLGLPAAPGRSAGAACNG